MFAAVGIVVVGLLGLLGAEVAFAFLARSFLQPSQQMPTWAFVSVGVVWLGAYSGAIWIWVT